MVYQPDSQEIHTLELKKIQPNPWNLIVLRYNQPHETSIAPSTGLDR